MLHQSKSCQECGATLVPKEGSCPDALLVPTGENKHQRHCLQIFEPVLLSEGSPVTGEHNCPSTYFSSGLLSLSPRLPLRSILGFREPQTCTAGRLGCKRHTKGSRHCTNIAPSAPFSLSHSMLDISPQAASRVCVIFGIQRVTVYSSRCILAAKGMPRVLRHWQMLLPPQLSCLDYPRCW